MNEPTTQKPKILIFDIETAPNRGYFWRIFKENISIDQIQANSHMLCWAAKWLGEEEVFYDSLPEHKKAFKKDMDNDFHISESLWHMLNEADLVVAHNGNNFDIPMANSRFLIHKLPPPSPVRKIDTLRIAKSTFKLPSYKLDYLCRYLGIGHKVKHDGFDMWLGCMQGDKHYWEEMVTYNIYDVVLLEELYMKIGPWSNNHPNLAVYVDDNDPICPFCLSKNLQRRGYATTNLSKFRRYQCQDCGKWPRGRKTVLSNAKRKSLVTNIV